MRKPATRGVMMTWIKWISLGTGVALMVLAVIVYLSATIDWRRSLKHLLFWIAAVVVIIVYVLCVWAYFLNHIGSGWP